MKLELFLMDGPGAAGGAEAPETLQLAAGVLFHVAAVVGQWVVVCGAAVGAEALTTLRTAASLCADVYPNCFFFLLF